jgi:hypothetical protein
MNSADPIRFREICDRAGHPKHASITASRQPHRVCSLGQQPAAGLIRCCNTFEQCAIRFAIGANPFAAIALRLPVARHKHARRHFARSLGWRRQDEVCRADRLNFDVKIDAIQKRPGHLCLIVGRTAWCPGARQCGIAEMSAAARIHRGYQLHTRRKCDMRIGTRDADRSGFERLAQ